MLLILLKEETMTGKERILAALHHKEGDRVPTGENQVNGPLASRIIVRHTCCCTGWEETNYLWEGRRDEVAEDYKKTFIDLVNILEWDYVRVPLVPAKKEYVRPKITGPYSFIDEEGHAFSNNRGYP
jgi:hypothetical protein